MERERSVLGLYADGPVGMADPIFMMRIEARQLAIWAAQEGLELRPTLQQVRNQVEGLFGEVLQPLVDATATTAWLETTAEEGGHHG
jgi:hypothetical protein